jgi:Flp pilus assembly pilin Flp
MSDDGHRPGLAVQAAAVPQLPSRPDAGQATVELALLLPLVAVLLVALVQAGLLVRDQVLVIHAAREAARAAAVDHDPGAAERAARSAGPLDTRRLRARVEGRGARGSRVTVHLAYDPPSRVPLVGGLLGDVRLRASATMRVER